MKTITVRSQKIMLTKDIKSLTQYLNDCNEIIARNNPQPNGCFYLHGEVIARKFKNVRAVLKATPMLKAEAELKNSIYLRNLLNS